MSDTSVTFAWILSGVALLAWIMIGVAIVRGRTAGAMESGWKNRLIWLPVWLVCGLGGFWGLTLHEATTVNFADADPPTIVESRQTEARSPFVVRTVTDARDLNGEFVQSEVRSRIQLPLALILFFAGFFLRVHHLGARSSPGRGGAAMLLLVALAASSGCEGSSGEVARPDRVFAPVQWDTLFLVESTADDSLIYRVDRLAADAHGLSVLDGIAPRVARFDWQGDLRWYAGGRGGGPGELQQPRRLRTDPAGTSWVLDVMAQRISAYDESGRHVATVFLQELPPSIDEFALAAGGESFFTVIPDDGVLDILEFDLGGIVLNRSRVAIRGEPAAMALQGHIGVQPGQGVWSYAFAMGDGLLRFRGTAELGPPSPFPVAVPFAGISEEIRRSGMTTERTIRVQERTWGAGAAVAHGERVYVLLPDDDNRYTLLDSYDLGSGEYVETLRLPRSASTLALEGNRLILGFNSPHPTLLALAFRY